jgi:PPOX class probable F420-dependent enzyme
MVSVLPDTSTPFGQRVAAHLREDLVAWLTTVAADGTPQPNPVWFLWDGETILIYTLNGAWRLEHIRRNQHVAFHLNGDEAGNDVVVITGEARITTGEPLADQTAAYVAKYAGHIKRAFSHGDNWTNDHWAQDYAVTVRVTPSRVRGF